MRRAVPLVVLALAGAAAWLALRARDGAPPETVPSATPSREPQDRGATPAEPASARVSAAPQPDAPEPPASEPADERSELARELELVAGSFLGEDPRVADLMRLVQELAQVSVIEPASLAVERDEEGGLRFARGALVAGDLRGTFLVEEGTFHVTFAGAVAAAPWFQRDLQLTFADDGAHAERCRAAVQFQPRPEDAAAATDAERLVGWTLAVSPEAGAELRPMTAAPDEGGWRIGAGREGELREMPWISNTACFDAWLTLLAPVIH